MFSDSPLAPLKPLVLQSWEDRLRSNFMDIIAQAGSQSDVYRTQQQLLRACERKHGTFLKDQQPVGAHEAYGEAVDNYSFEKDTVRSQDGLMSLGDSSEAGDLPSVSSVSAGDDEIPSFYIGEKPELQNSPS